MCEKRLVFSYCKGTYCTQIGNISHEELSPRPSGLSFLKILFHEHLLYYGVLYVIFCISYQLNDILHCGLLFDQKWISLLHGWCFGRCCLNGFILRFVIFWVPSGLRRLIRAVMT